MSAKILTWEEVAKHSSRESCWVVIKGRAFDVTNFLDDHPGGAKSLLRYGGKDGTEEYELLHSAGTIEKTLSPGMLFAFVSEFSLTKGQSSV
jgi:L-lactate dehydrogenase (cytochrome)